MTPSELSVVSDFMGCYHCREKYVFLTRDGEWKKAKRRKKLRNATVFPKGVHQSAVSACVTPLFLLLVKSACCLIVHGSFVNQNQTSPFVIECI